MSFQDDYSKEIHQVGHVEERDALVRIFRTLADPVRLRLLDYVAAEERTLGECATHIGLSHSEVSVHLACLRDCGYLSARQVNRSVYYRVTDSQATELMRVASAFASDNAKAIVSCSRMGDEDCAERSASLSVCEEARCP